MREPHAARLVNLCSLVGLTEEEALYALGVWCATVEYAWTFVHSRRVRVPRWPPGRESLVTATLP